MIGETGKGILGVGRIVSRAYRRNVPGDIYLGNSHSVGHIRMTGETRKQNKM